MADLQSQAGLIGRDLEAQPVPNDLRAAVRKDGLQRGARIDGRPMGVIEIGAGVGGVIAGVNQPMCDVKICWLAEVGCVKGLRTESAWGKAQREQRQSGDGVRA